MPCADTPFPIPHSHITELGRALGKFTRFTLTLNPIQQQIHSILVVAEGRLIVLVDLAVQSHANLLGRLHQVISLCHGCLVLDPWRAKWT